MAALAAYQQDFASRIKTPENHDAKQAAALVTEARNIIGRTGLGPALAPTLLEHVQHWPSWSKRDDFQQYVGFPATDIAASEDKSDPKAKLTGVLFTYEGQRYGVRILDTGYHSLPDGDSYESGTIELIVGQETVLGLDINRDLAEEYSRWRWTNVSTFKVGPWTKHLIEIAAYIENKSKSYMTDFHDKDALARAKDIKI